jgi:hypothetical protein
MINSVSMNNKSYGKYETLGGLDKSCLRNLTTPIREEELIAKVGVGLIPAEDMP